MSSSHSFFSLYMASMTGAIVAWRYGKATIWWERERREIGEREERERRERKKNKYEGKTILVIVT